MTVKQFVMLLTSQSIISTYNAKHSKNVYEETCYILHIFCKDGKELSVQAHGAVHTEFEDVDYDLIHRSKTFGRKLLACETDCEDLDQYGINSIEEIEAYVESHGGIDIEATVAAGVERAISLLEEENKGRL